MNATTPDYCLLFIHHWSTCMQKSEWAAWAQAFFSVLAILAGAAFVMWTGRLNRAAMLDSQTRADIERARAALDVVAENLLLAQRASDHLIQFAGALPEKMLESHGDAVDVLLHFDVHGFHPSSLRTSILQARSAAEFAFNTITNINSVRKPGGSFMDLAGHEQWLEQSIERMEGAHSAIKMWIRFREHMPEALFRL